MNKEEITAVLSKCKLGTIVAVEGWGTYWTIGEIQKILEPNSEYNNTNRYDVKIVDMTEHSPYDSRSDVYRFEDIETIVILEGAENE